MYTAPSAVAISIGPRTTLAGQPHGSVASHFSTVYVVEESGIAAMSSQLGTISVELPESTNSRTGEPSVWPLNDTSM